MIRQHLTPDRLFSLGAVALVLAVVVVLVPVPGRGLLAPVVDRGAVRLLALVATVAVVRSLARAARRGVSTATDGGDEPDLVDWPGASEADDTGRQTLGVGGFGWGSEPGNSDFEAALAAATGPWDDIRRRDGREQVRETLRALAVDAVAESEGVERARAAARVADGRWTDRRRAAVLLGDDVGPLSPSTRLVDWASGRPYGRQVDAAAVAIAERAGVETEVTAP